MHKCYSKNLAAKNAMGANNLEMRETENNQLLLRFLRHLRQMMLLFWHSPRIPLRCIQATELKDLNA